MTTIRLDRSDGKYIELNLPDNPSELSLSKKLDFDFAQMRAIAYLTKHGEDLYKHRGGYLLIIARGLSEFFEVDFAEWMKLKGISLLEISESDFNEHIQTIAGMVKGINKRQLEKNFLTIWNRINQVIAMADETDTPEAIDYKGKSYQLPKVSKDPLTGRPVHEEPTTKQAIEIIQVNHMYDVWLRDNAIQKGSDTDKNWMFSKLVSEVVLMMEPDDIPMEDEDQFKTWMRELLVHWQDIDWLTTKYITTWFSSYIHELRQDRENKWFFESTWTPTNAEEAEAAAKQKAQSRRIFDAVGIKSIIPQLLELNPFQRNGESKLGSVMRSKFRNAVKLISTHNARS